MRIRYSEMLIEEAEALKYEAFVPDLGKIRSAAKHLLGLISNMLDLSKIEAGRMDLYLERFDIAEMVDQVAVTIQPLVKENANRLEVACARGLGEMVADLHAVYGDRGRLHSTV